MKRWLIFALYWAASQTTAWAHEVHHRIETSAAVVVTLTYANGQPFAYEKYALTPAGQETPQQVGNTDAQGRIAFVPGAMEKWRVQATSADGHGVNLDFTVPLTGITATTAESTPRWLLAMLGLSLIFGIFGLIQLLAKKKA
jgi:nickel transport protein